MKHFAFRLSFLITLLSGLSHSVAEDTTVAEDTVPINPHLVDADTLISGGMLYLGDGKKPALGDVAIHDGKIVAVGKFPVGKVIHRIDCQGLMVAPGFIDLHNHSDEQILSPSTRACVNYLTQGCTTVVTGNCGGGHVDVGSYFEKVDLLGVGVNVAHLIPQGDLREQVMGSTNRPATAEELDKMKSLVRLAMQQGAMGMSTGLIYVPGSYASTEELIALAQVVAQGGGIYASHIRGEDVRLLDSINEILRINLEAGLPIHISHFKSIGEKNWGVVRAAAKIIEEAHAEGARITADQYPYIASSNSLEATLVPTWAQAGGRVELRRRLDDTEAGPKIRRVMQEVLTDARDGENLHIGDYAPRPEWAGRSLKEIARTENLSVLDLSIQIVSTAHAQMVKFNMSEGDVRHIMRLPWVATASDGHACIPDATMPHPRSYGTFSRKLGHYAIQEKVIPLELAIRSSTGLPADILGLQDRGYLKPGQMADIVVFDANSLSDMATFQQPHQYSQGIKYVYVNGQPAIFAGTPTGALAGRAIRHVISQQEK